MTQEPYEDEFEDEDGGIDDGPDERDMDLMDGSWEEKYYGGRLRSRDWNAIGVAIAVLVLLGLTLPLLLVFLR